MGLVVGSALGLNEGRLVIGLVVGSVQRAAIMSVYSEQMRYFQTTPKVNRFKSQRVKSKLHHTALEINIEDDEY